MTEAGPGHVVAIAPFLENYRCRVLACPDYENDVEEKHFSVVHRLDLFWGHSCCQMVVYEHVETGNGEANVVFDNCPREEKTVRAAQNGDTSHWHRRYGDPRI